MLEVIAFDPGGTTGFARGWIPERCLTEAEVDVLPGLRFTVGQITGPESSQADEIATILLQHDGPIVIESFTLRQFRQDPDLLSPVRMAARIEQINDSLEWDGWPGDGKLPLFYQTPATAKSTATDERLRRWGLWTPGAPHANDAMRHLIVFLRKCKTDVAFSRKAFPELRA